MNNNYNIENDSSLTSIVAEIELENYNDLSYKIIGACMEVYNTMGRGFLEAVYKDCLCVELEKRKIEFKSVKIPRAYFADFIIEDKIILEIKAQSGIIEENLKQTINYLAVSKCKIGLIVNFGESSLKYKRIIL